MAERVATRGIDGITPHPTHQAAGDPLALLLRILDLLPRDAELAVARDGSRWLLGIYPDAVVAAYGAAAFQALDRLAEGWWAGFLSYDLGRSVEQIVSRVPDDLDVPDLMLARFDARVAVDPSGVHVEGDGATRPLLEIACRRAREGLGGPRARRLDLGPWSSSLSRGDFEARASAVVQLIRAGECYQVNLTRRLTCERSADPLALFAALAVGNPAPHAALLRLAGTAVVSASPERFLSRRGTRVETRPIKGTARDPSVLVRSAKDRAENVMIVDLARNDLGRVCAYGSVQVPDLCGVEPHPGLFHLVSTVTGQLRAGVGTGELLRATFPPASITGAPKARVLQAIEDLEPCRRGVYCGAVGWIDADRAALDLNVAIRTFVIAGGRTHLGVGAGIVADSDPAAEWRETELKAAKLLALAGT